MNDLLKKSSDQEKEKLRKKEQPEWTDTNKLRHPRHLGLRRSKKPREVIREN